jgi:hypothetical protein
MPTDAPTWLRDILTELARAQEQTGALLARHDERLDRLTAAQTETATQLAQLVGVVQQMNTRLRGVENRLGDLAGQVWEGDARELAPRWFCDFSAGVRPLSDAERNSLLDRAVNAGTLTRPEAAIRRADLICDATDPDSGAPLRVLAEVSARVDVHDVDRAAERAALLARLGTPALAAVIGRRLDPDADQQAAALGVRTVIDPDA